MYVCTYRRGGRRRPSRSRSFSLSLSPRPLFRPLRRVCSRATFLKGMAFSPSIHTHTHIYVRIRTPNDHNRESEKKIRLRAALRKKCARILPQEQQRRVHSSVRQVLLLLFLYCLLRVVDPPLIYIRTHRVFSPVRLAPTHFLPLPRVPPPPPSLYSQSTPSVR